MTRLSRPARLGGLLAALAVALLAGACTSGGSAITVTDAWARASASTAAAGAAYMTIANGGSAADALVGASSPAATTVEVHETVVVSGSPSPAASGGMGGSMPSTSPDAGGGMMGMQPVARLEIPAGGSVQLKPGSYHIMLIGLTRDLTVGDTIEITLRFEKAGEVKVTAPVRES